MLNISDPGESINEYLLFGIAFFFGLSRGGGGEGSGRGGGWGGSSTVLFRKWFPLHGASTAAAKGAVANLGGVHNIAKA